MITAIEYWEMTMCIMCLEFANSRMKMFEVRKALTELVATTKDEQDLKHFKDLAKMNDEELAAQAKRFSANVEEDKL